MGFDFQDILDPLDLSGRKAAKRAQEENEKNVKNAIDDIDQGAAFALSDYDQSMWQFEDALAFFQQGFPAVMGDLSGDESFAFAEKEHRQAIADIDDSSISSGRFGDSARGSLKAGERGRYSRSTSAISASLGSLRSEARLKGITQTSGLMQSLGGAYERRGSLEQQHGTDISNTRMQVQHEGAQGVKPQDVVGIVGSLFSDRRLKKNIKRVGTYHGHPWYSYEWRDGSGHSEGVIAQEVQVTRPDLVTEVDGFLAVRYGGL